MNEKRSFFRVHVVTVVAAVLLAGLCFAVQTHWFVQRTYSPKFGSYPDKKKLIVAQHFKSEMGWPYVYQNSSSTSRFWDLKQSDIDPAELAVLSSAPASSKYSLQELNALAPTLGKFLLDESAETPFSSSRRSYHDNEALNKNLAVWTIGIFAFCTGLEVVLRFNLRRGYSSRKIIRAAFYPISIRFSLLTFLIFTTSLGMLLGFCLIPTTVERFAIEIRPLGIESTNSGGLFAAKGTRTVSIGWPEIHESSAASRTARIAIDEHAFNKENLPERLRELQNLRSNFGWKEKVLYPIAATESELNAHAPNLYAETLRQWNTESEPMYTDSDNNVLARNIASCIGLSVLIAIVAELLQRAWRWRKNKRHGGRDAPTTIIDPLSSPQSAGR